LTIYYWGEFGVVVPEPELGVMLVPEPMPDPPMGVLVLLAG
jgi:hypothetical protein